jgi:hypothetical protein
MFSEAMDKRIFFYNKKGEKRFKIPEKMFSKAVPLQVRASEVEKKITIKNSRYQRRCSLKRCRFEFAPVRWLFWTTTALSPNICRVPKKKRVVVSEVIILDNHEPRP